MLAGIDACVISKKRLARPLLARLFLPEQRRQITRAMQHAQDQRRNFGGVVNEQARIAGQRQEAGWFVGEFRSCSVDFGKIIQASGRAGDRLAQATRGSRVILCDPVDRLKEVAAVRGESSAGISARCR
jgi:hypothetical protein